MAKYIKRIRYRRRFVFRPHFKLIKPTSSHILKSDSKENKTIEQKEIGESEMEQDLNLHKENPKPIKDSEHNAINVVKEAENLAYFEKGQDPYAYLVSQLPYILNSIPNLLHEPGSNNANNEDQETKIETSHKKIIKNSRHASEQRYIIQSKTADNTAEHNITSIQIKTDSISEVKHEISKQPKQTLPLQAEETLLKKPTDNINAVVHINDKPRIVCLSTPTKKVQLELKQLTWLEWGKQVHIQSNLLLASLKPLGTTRDSVWPESTKSSNQQVADNAKKLNLTKHLNKCPQQAIESQKFQFIHSNVLSLANDNELTLSEFLMYLSSIKGMSDLMNNSELSRIAQVYFSLPKQSLNQLTTTRFLMQALKNNQLLPKLNWLDCVLPSLALQKKMKLNVNCLPAYLESAPYNCFYKLSQGKQTCYLEINKYYVCLSDGKEKPLIVSQPNFIHYLTSSFLPNVIKSARFSQLETAGPINLLAYAADDKAINKLKVQLTNKLYQGREQWNQQGTALFSEFISNHNSK